MQYKVVYPNAVCLPWKIWITCLVSKVFSITLLSPFIAVSVSTVGMFTLYGNMRQQGHRGVMLYVHSKYNYKRTGNIDAWLTDAAIGDNSVFVITLLPGGDLHYAVPTVTFIIGGIFHGLVGRDLEWKGLLQNLKNVNIKGKGCLKVNIYCFFKDTLHCCYMHLYLDWQPAINVFEIERSLVFTECKSVICAEALQFLLIAHHKYLNKRQNNRVPCILALYEITLKTIICHPSW